MSPRSIPAILARTRDVDTTIRKFVYSAIFEPNCIVAAGPDQADETMGILHPRALTIAQRELLVRNGLGEREENVKTAASKLISTWLDVARPPVIKAEAHETEADIVAFLNLFDLVENSTGEDALFSLFKSRSDVLDALKFDGVCPFALPTF